MTREPITCPECKKSFIPVARQVYCCKECWKKAYKRTETERKKMVKDFLFRLIETE